MVGYIEGSWSTQLRLKGRYKEMWIGHWNRGGMKLRMKLVRGRSGFGRNDTDKLNNDTNNLSTSCSITREKWICFGWGLGWVGQKPKRIRKVRHLQHHESGKYLNYTLCSSSSSGRYDAVHAPPARQHARLLYMRLTFHRNNTLFGSHALTQPRELALLRHEPLLLILCFIIVGFHGRWDFRRTAHARP